MLVTVHGTYENGVVRLSEPLPDIASLPAGEVLVTFLASKPERATVATLSPKRFSFDEALALPTTPGSSVSDAVLEEREESDW